MTEIRTRQADASSLDPVSPSNPFPVQLVTPPYERETGLIREFARRSGDLGLYLAVDGRVFLASDADQNDTVTGQTSFADTTPTFTLRVPAGTVCFPLMVSLGQTGTVAGDAISVIIEMDNEDRYASGGTSEGVINTRTGSANTNKCTLYSGATLSAGAGKRLYGVTVGQDVSPAEGISNEILWTPTSTPEPLVGPASLNVYTYAGTTGPTWFWSFKWAEFPASWLN